MIHIIAAIEIVPGKREEFLEHFRDLVPLVHEEHGCLMYVPAVDVETSIPSQIPPLENVLHVVEQWDSLESLEDHLMAPHMMQFRAKVKDLVVGISLQVLEPV